MRKALQLAFILAFFTGAVSAAVPSATSFTSVSDNSISVTWTLSPPSGASWMVLSEDPLFTTWVSSQARAISQYSNVYNSGISANATYYFKVKSIDDADAFYSAGISTVTPPVMPSAVVLSEVNFSSFTASWSGGNNGPGTSYWAETSLDDSFAINLLSSGTAPGALYTGLNPNATYFLRVKTLGFGGQDSAYNFYGSTITRANQPGSEAYALVFSTGLSVIWDDNGNPTGTRYDFVVSTSAGFSTVNYSTLTPGSYYEAAGLQPNTTHYFKAAAVNWGGQYSDYTVFVPTLTYAAVPAEESPGLGAPGAASVQTQWLPNGNPGYTEYYVQASTSSDFLGFDAGPKVWFTGPAYLVAGLESGQPYYFRVRARDLNGRPGGWLTLGSATTVAGADTTTPSVIDLQGGDAAWRGEAGGAYRVHFSDLGSGLDRFYVKITTGPGFTGTIVADWALTVGGLNSADSYDSDWALPALSYAAIQENVTSYVSVRVYDSSGNFTVSGDVFYVLRDTTPPNIINNAASPPGWLAVNPGAIFDVDFNDALSGLGQLQYSASANPGAADAGVLGWTAVDGAFVPGPGYTALWGVNFAGLRDGVTNYISVRAADAAGNSRTLSDVFRILKNTVGPAVAITSPAGAYVSTITAITGSASAMNEISPVAGNQVAIQELTGGLYYDGASFASGTEVWLGASGLSAWSYNTSTVPFAAGVQYKAYARSRDINSFLSVTPYPNATFQLDQVLPSVTLSSPLAGATLTLFDAVEGLAADTGGSGLGAVEIYVKQVADGKWWNFASDSWGGIPVASAAAPGATWTFSPGAGLRGGLSHNQQYFVTVLSKDGAVPPNASGFGAAGSTFTWVDNVPPEAVTAFTPSTGAAPGRVDLAWTFPGDDGGALALTYGEFAVQYSTFAGAVFSTQAVQVLISTSMVRPGSALSYTIAGLTPEATYYFRMWVQDDAGLWSAPSPLASTIAGERLNDMIAGSVKTPGGLGVTGVMVDAISSLGLVVASAYTLDDGLGSFTLTSLPDGLYRVQATWLEDGFSSAVAKDQIPMGYADTNFVLSMDYALASVSGSLPAAIPSGLRPASAGSEAQLWRGARLTASARPDAAGRFAIRNLLPGPYSLRVRGEDGIWKNFEIKLAAGQNLEIKPLGQLLRKASLYAYPNPAASYIKFHLETEIFPVRKTLSIFSVDGTLVKSVEDGDAGWTGAGPAYEYRWDFSGVKPASGVYLYSVKLRHELSGETDGAVKKFAVIR